MRRGTGFQKRISKTLTRSYSHSFLPQEPAYDLNAQKTVGRELVNHIYKKKKECLSSFTTFHNSLISSSNLLIKSYWELHPFLNVHTRPIVLVFMIIMLNGQILISAGTD